MPGGFCRSCNAYNTSERDLERPPLPLNQWRQDTYRLVERPAHRTDSDRPVIGKRLLHENRH